jgi:hypothetical protein
MAANKSLSADSLFALVRSGFERIPDRRAENAKISLPDALMSGFAVFSLKDPSLLAFDERRRTDSNLKSIYRIQKAPCDTQMRTILDGVEPEDNRPVFRDVFRRLQREKRLDEFVFLGGSYLVSLDGTGYFSSKKVHCDGCLQKVNKKTGEVTYSHQLMGAVVIHPDRREVIPLMPEPIMKQDGETKNDCERNAAKRFLILGVKEGDHEYLFEQVALARQEGRTTEFGRPSLSNEMEEYCIVSPSSTRCP